MTQRTPDLPALAAVLDEEELVALGDIVREFDRDGGSAILDRQFAAAHAALREPLAQGGRRGGEAARLRAAYAAVALLFVPAGAPGESR